jgi:hypothetical protein
MKLAKKLGLLVTVLFSIQWAEAQIGLRISTNDTFPNPFIYGNSFSFNALVKNDSSTTFNDRIGFGYSINSGAAQTNPDSLAGVSFDTLIAGLQLGEIISKTIVVNVDGPQFLVSPSVVVIWPISTSKQALDSLVISFTVLLPAGVADVGESNIKAYIINNSLMVQAEQEIQLKQVRIYDILGREILNQRNPSAAIPLPVMGSGIYLTEITYNNNQRKVFRFFK